MVSLTGFRGFHRDPTSEGRLLFVGCGMLDLERIRVERTSAFRYLWRALAKRTGQSLSLSYMNHVLQPSCVPPTRAGACGGAHH